MELHEFTKYVKSARNYKFARNYSVLLITFTIIGFILCFFNMESICSLYTSASFFLMSFSYILREQKEIFMFITFLLISLIFITLFTIFYLKSKTNRKYILALLIMVIIDTIFLLINVFGALTRFVNLLIHGLLIYQLFIAFKSSKSLEDDFEEGVSLTEADITEIYNFLRIQKDNNN